MPIHKFIRKCPRVPSKPPVAVVWHPYENQQHPPVQLDEFKWLVYAQEDSSNTYTDSCYFLSVEHLIDRLSRISTSRRQH